MRDYLGSVRAIYDITTPANEVEDASEHVLEQSDYYAFGGRIDTPYQAYDQTNRYRYNGKEQLRFESLNLDPGLTDYGARYYAPKFGRWTSPDPLADKYYSISPYVFCGNNPVNFVDPFGMDIWEIDNNGVIEWIEESKEHRLYSVNTEGKRNSSYISVQNRDILDAFAGKRNGAHFSSYSGVNDMITVFKFAADHSNVEWSFHRGQDNMYTIVTSHSPDGVDRYKDITGRNELPIASVHSHPNQETSFYNEAYTMGYYGGTYPNDYELLREGRSPAYNYVYFPKSKNLYNVSLYSPTFIKKIYSPKSFYFGTLNHK